MVKNEHTNRETDVRTIAVSALVGLVMCVAAMLCIGLLMKNEIIPVGKWELTSKAGLIAGAVCSSVYVCLKVRKKKLAHSVLGNLLMITLLGIISLLFSGCQFTVWGIFAGLLIVMLVSFLCCQFGRMQNKKRKHR